MARKKRHTKKESNAICVAVGNVWGPDQGIIGGSNDSLGHTQDTAYGGLPGNNGIPACYWHTGNGSEYEYGQFIVGDNDRVYCRIYHVHLHGDHVVPENYNYQLCMRGGQRGSFVWPDYPASPDANEVLWINDIPSDGHIDFTQDFNGGLAAAWTKNNIGSGIDGSWRDVGSIDDFIYYDDPSGYAVGHAYIGGCGRYTTQSGIHPNPRHFTFTAEHLPLLYYPGAIYDGSNWVSSNSSGHYDKTYKNNNWEDVKCMEGSAVSDQDQANVYKNNAWGKADKY